MGILDRISEANKRRLDMYDKEAELRYILPSIDMQKVHDLIVYYNEKLKQLPVGGDFIQVYDAIRYPLLDGVSFDDAYSMVMGRIEFAFEMNKLDYMTGRKHNFDI